jgi:two-component system nitrogen regulation sensor histidine kinase GlnL
MASFMSAAPRRRSQRDPRLRAQPASTHTQDLPLDTVLASLGEAVIIIDGASAIVLFNPAAEQLMGRAHAHVIGRPLAEIFQRTPGVAEMVARTFATGQTQARNGEIRPPRARPVPVRLHTSAIWDQNGAGIRGTVLTIHDLSYQQALEEAARRADRLAHVSTLVAGLAHEVKNPLGGIKGAAQLLSLRLRERPEVNQYSELIVRETNRLSKLVDELLMIGAPRPPEAVAINIHKIVQEVLVLMQPEIEAGGIALRTEFDPSLPEARGDPEQLTQVLLNLVKNALEAMRGTPADAPRALTLVTRMETDFHLLREQEGRGKFLRVEVIDTGPGVAPAARERVFEPFFSTKPRGTGLGLAICQRIVAAHGGSIHLDDGLRGGTVCTLTLPLAS